MRLLRSVLYVPADKARALAKAATLPCDALIVDLEDAVAPEAKAAARDALPEVLTADVGHRLRIVRVNGADTPWGADDMAAVAAHAPDAVLLPKVEGPEAVAAIPEGPCVWAMVETPRGVLDAPSIARAVAARGGVVVAGTNDLAADLGARVGPGRAPLLHALGALVLAARAARVPVLDGVYNTLRDPEGLAAECAQGRDMGFDGKTLIHPDQIAAANAAFAPDDAEIDHARRVVAAFEAAPGQGVAVLDGRLIEGLHAAAARATLARADAIATRSRP
ncbi:MAG: HpcH/HpaI aldolase/citrate lyase family protein [Shimia sp.]